MQIIGEKQAEVLWLPPVNDLMPIKTAPHVQRVLERGMERGVLLQCRNSNIVAYRLCKYAASVVIFQWSLLNWHNYFPVAHLRCDVSLEEGEY